MFRNTKQQKSKLIIKPRNLCTCEKEFTQGVPFTFKREISLITV